MGGFYLSVAPSGACGGGRVLRERPSSERSRSTSASSKPARRRGLKQLGVSRAADIGDLDAMSAEGIQIPPPIDESEAA
jgi:hypothetical protein